MDPQPTEIYNFKAPDGIDNRLTRYRGGSKGPVMVVHGAGVSRRYVYAADSAGKLHRLPDKK